MVLRSRARIRGRELAFVRAVTEVQLAKGLSYRAFTARLRRIERFHVEQLSRNKFLAQEIKRRISELLLKEAILRGCSFNICRRRMNEIRALGFTDIEQKSMCLFFYARAARDRGHFHIAKDTAAGMAKELDSSLRRKRSLLGKDWLKALTSLLSELDASHEKRTAES